MLDCRLKAVASFVRRGSRLIDVGTDHALLPCALVAAGHCPGAIASDVRRGPTEAARRSIISTGLSDRIDVRLGDGLSTVGAEEVDDIVIAGMGGETIASILEAAPWVQNPRYRLILQPMTRAERLRRYLFENGFTILEELPVTDGHHHYTVQCVEYTGEAFTPDEASCYVGQLPVPAGNGFLNSVCERLRKQEQAKPNEELILCIRRIEAYMRGEWRVKYANDG